ncbi:uncharacterized protein I303_105052 [Kwoniella dejecticola CBS 10117]|uniref:RING-type domain-containing protein n=1 Tax=Kwoniella dejecticola CBS 10117 TaxID=1296121 RepID=A0A1A6A3K8_9TREE|nr:uncharacterized protein I303_05502 [Kwoniella dejecticola CBS 10117]OBR84643.1 hypothetical protein I303_05502 [Kwoniella dejecticola CBS 10117]
MSSSSHTVTSGWYTNAYSGPFRSNRLRAPSLLPGSARRPVIIPVQQTLVVDVAHNHTNPNAANTDDSNKNVRRRETIFGPDVGEDDEPGWTETQNQEIGVEKVREWVERSKNEEGLHATTTLQALVNLKRPTLLLQQIESPSAIDENSVTGPGGGRSSIDKTEEEDITTVTENAVTSSPQRNSLSGAGHRKRDSAQIIQTTPLHTLNFKYDATTPMVRVQLEIYPTPKDPLALARLSLSEEGESVGAKEVVEDHEPKIIYSGLHPGGFNQGFTLPYSSALDLSDAIIPIEEQQAQEQAQQDAAAAAAATPTETDGTNNEAQATGVPEPVTTPPEEGGSRWRRGLFRRNREEDVENAAAIEMTNRANGAATAATAAGQAGEGEANGEAQKKKEIEKGMRLLIRIDGVGPEGQALPRKNAQLTHILISGTWVSDNNASTTDTTQTIPSGPAGKRVWVVKVARREAVIGSHTFLLKEIYGLSSTSTSSTSNNTQYPPAADDPYASTPNECIVCLTSPRDVVLLPCRHLVVCRDCAVGMVEYGAGGKVGRREDGENGAADGAAAGTTPGAGASGSGTAAAPTPQVAGGTTTAGRERRKKKVKGWYCPVCRQPYTSLLRLALPESSKPSPDADAEGGEESHSHSHDLARVPSRAASVRTTRTTRSVLAPSIAPTLPDGAERMLDDLRPDDVKARDGLDNDNDDDEDEGDNPGTNTAINGHAQGGVGVGERPQFVIGQEDADAKKVETEHREHAPGAHGNSAAFDLGRPIDQTHTQNRDSLDGGRRSQDGQGQGKGWKEI